MKRTTFLVVLLLTFTSIVIGCSSNGSTGKEPAFESVIEIFDAKWSSDTDDGETKEISE
ncbi:hypothetical protein J45TS6_35550 [Paenibacillus sp. J45TS6]|uniref:hypothetical protein n=1 Tax=Paenibacillus sp. J45TS6 TaxID=2807196 RepID=UPI001B17B1D5|nr:hypothetical protein [Paenibacillus sp. J45TS6]GIP45096.1 hypothetical protein J45TS6_35550 [Paenibacillus sp. J45TS6]